MSAVAWDHVSVRYPQADRDALRDICLAIAPGELSLVVGATGSGKTTLLRTINGSVPHSTGGLLTGMVRTAGRDTRTHPPRELAGVVSMVPQRPADAFIADTVTAELAYGMECLGVTATAMRHRVEQSIDLLGLADLRDRPLSSLSAGQQQRVAIAAAVITEPEVLVLDEPTSALDPTSAEEVLAALHRLVHDLGTTVVLSEHRLERVVQFADSAIHLDTEGAIAGSVAHVLAQPRALGIAPPVVGLARALGWAQLPVSIRQARAAAQADSRLAQLHPPQVTAPTYGPVVAEAIGVAAHYPGPTPALTGADLRLHSGQVLALMGRNGAGKTTLLECFAGLQQISRGKLLICGQERKSRKEVRQRVALVPADPADLLLSDRVDRELALADRQAGAAAGTATAILSELLPGIDDLAHPRYLSCGQRLALALAVILPRNPQVLLLDEPTRGLDYPAKNRTTTMLRGLAARGIGIVVVTHDIELAAQLADDVAVMAQGQVVATGPARELLTGQPSFAPQVAKVLGPGWLSIAEVSSALGSAW